MQIDNYWRNNLTNNNIAIWINNAVVSTSLITLVNNSNNFIEANAISVDLPIGAPLAFNILSYWALNDPMGYHYQWYPNSWNIVAARMNSSTNSIKNSAINGSTSNSTQNLGFSTNFVIGDNNNMGWLQINGSLISLSAQAIKYFQKSWAFCFFNYFINTFVGYQSLSFLHYYIDFKNSYN